MENDPLFQKCSQYMSTLCLQIGERSVGSQGNQDATTFFQQAMDTLGWATESQAFTALDWVGGEASLRAGGADFEVQPSPYANGCALQAELAAVGLPAELEQADLRGKIALLHGEIAKEQIMPKNFVFYNPEEHQKIIALLEQKQPAALVCATGRNSALAGGAYPFPLIEDGDFDIPSVYMTEEEGRRLLPCAGGTARLVSIATRVPSSGQNIIARKGSRPDGRIVVSAHIDAKKGTPGAIDNASGVAVLLLLAELLQGDPGSRMVEMAAFNGEDYYAVPGQMLYLGNNQGRFEQIALNINIDGAGYHEGKSAFSYYGLPEEIEAAANTAIAPFEGITVGGPWYQGDHSIFIQLGRPAIAVTSLWFSENMDSQAITHTPKDNLGIVSCARLVEIARALERLIRGLAGNG